MENVSVLQQRRVVLDSHRVFGRFLTRSIINELFKMFDSNSLYNVQKITTRIIR